MDHPLDFDYEIDGAAVNAEASYIDQSATTNQYEIIENLPNWHTCYRLYFERINNEAIDTKNATISYINSCCAMEEEIAMHRSDVKRFTKK